MNITAEENRYYGDKGWESDLPLFAEVAASPKQWLGTAAEHLYASQILLPLVENRYQKIKQAMKEHKQISLEPSLTGIYFLHCALSVENSTKSIISIQHNEEIIKEIKSTSKTPKILLGHNLLDLVNRIEFQIDIDQEYILTFLTRYGIWSGKYHQPIKNTDNSTTDKLSDGNHYMIGGYNPKSIAKYLDFCIWFYNHAKEKVNQSIKSGV
jgi:hypothetical protein